MRRLSILVALVATFALSGTALAAPPTVRVGALLPDWTTGVYSAYYGPPDYLAVSPGDTAVYKGREAGIIKAGLTADPGCAPLIYCDEGLFAFIPAVKIEKFAARPLTYTVVNQYGINPVWITIEIDTGTVGDRSDNISYQFVPAPYGSVGYVTVNAGTGTWFQWTNDSGDITGSPSKTLAEIAIDHPGVNVVRTYLRLGMGDSYGPGPDGTQAWVDKAAIGGVTYDFVVNHDDHHDGGHDGGDEDHGHHGGHHDHGHHGGHHDHGHHGDDSP